MTYEVKIEGREITVGLRRSNVDPNRWTCRLNGKEFELDALQVEAGVLSILIDGRSHEARRDGTTSEQRIVLNGKTFSCEVRDPRALRGRRAAGGAAQGPKKIAAPMPGKVVRVTSPTGTEVEAGQGVIVIEAMKMQNELKSPKKGIVQKVLAAVGTAVNAGDVLAIIE
jgi:biotin carboxyl carrier protein